ncbi:MAG: hypothetical protein ACM31P_09450 [Actinomycetota bacterium]
MDHHAIEEIIACLRGERTVYPYYRDRYSIGLLRQLSRHGRRAEPLSVASLKKFLFAPTSEVPPFLAEDKEVRQVLRRNPEIGFFCLRPDSSVQTGGPLMD